MFKKIEYVYFSNIVYKTMVLEMKNRALKESELSKLNRLRDENIKELISANNIEGDIAKMNTAKLFLKNTIYVKNNL